MNYSLVVSVATEASIINLRKSLGSACELFLGFE